MGMREKVAAKRMATPKWIAVRMASAAKKAMTAKIAAKKMAKKWIAARMVNAPRKGMTARIAARNRSNQYQSI